MMTPEERDERMRVLEAIHRRMTAKAGCRLVAPPPDILNPRIAVPGLDRGHAYGWHLPDGLVLFLRSVHPGQLAEGRFELRNSLRGFIGAPEGYEDGIGQALKAPQGEGLLGGLPVLWEFAWGAALPLVWVGPTPPEAESLSGKPT
jgi:hypothetical protein